MLSGRMLMMSEGHEVMTLYISPALILLAELGFSSSMYPVLQYTTLNFIIFGPQHKKEENPFTRTRLTRYFSIAVSDGACLSHSLLT